MHECTIQKCPIPIVWLDTSVLIKLARINQSKPISEIDRERCIRIRDKIYELVRSGKLICPEASQADELTRGHDVFSDVTNELSLGVWTAHPHGVQSDQELRVMRSYIDGCGTTNLPYEDAFAEDPIRLLKTNLASDIFISVLQTPTAEKIEDISLRRENIHNQWECLRLNLRSKGITFQEQVETEYLGEIRESIHQSIGYTQNLLEKQDTTMNEFAGHLRMSRLYEAWQLYAGVTGDSKDFVQFFSSKHYKAIPSVEISAVLTARILTGDRKIRSGDAKDIEHLSTMLPYSDLMIVDRPMKRIVSELELDKKYKCRVCYIGDNSDMEQFFKKAILMESIL